MQTAWRKAKKTHQPEEWALFRKFRNWLHTVLRRSFTGCIESLGEHSSTNSKHFWQFFFKSKTGSQWIPATVRHGETVVSEALKRLLASISAFFRNLQECHQLYGELSQIEAFAIITSHLFISPSKMCTRYWPTWSEACKSFVADNISPRILKQCAVQLAPSLTALFNKFKVCLPRRYTFTVEVCHLWNLLPEEIRTRNTLSSFKYVHAIPCHPSNITFSCITKINLIHFTESKIPARRAVFAGTIRVCTVLLSLYILVTGFEKVFITVPVYFKPNK